MRGEKYIMTHKAPRRRPMNFWEIDWWRALLIPFYLQYKSHTNLSSAVPATVDFIVVLGVEHGVRLVDCVLCASRYQSFHLLQDHCRLLTWDSYNNESFGKVFTIKSHFCKLYWKEISLDNRLASKVMQIWGLTKYLFFKFTWNRICYIAIPDKVERRLDKMLSSFVNSGSLRSGNFSSSSERSSASSSLLNIVRHCDICSARFITRPGFGGFPIFIKIYLFDFMI